MLFLSDIGHSNKKANIRTLYLHIINKNDSLNYKKYKK
jgi:hypothetical protein